MIDKITFTTILVVATFIVATIFFRRKKVYYFLYAIILINLFSEVLGLIAVLTGKFTVLPFYNLNFILQPALWILLAGIILKDKKYSVVIASIFILFALTNLMFIEKSSLNSKTIIVGSFLYIGFYIWKHFKLIKEEQLSYFSSNDFLLLSAPLSFFFGISILLSFGDSGLRNTVILGKTLYFIIQFLANFIFYGLLILYIIKSRNEGKEQLAHD